MPSTTDHLDCTVITDAIIGNALELASHTTPGDAVIIHYGYPDEATRYQMIAMSLNIKARAAGIRYEQTLVDAHTFTVLT